MKKIFFLEEEMKRDMSSVKHEFYSTEKCSDRFQLKNKMISQK